LGVRVSKKEKTHTLLISLINATTTQNKNRLKTSNNNSLSEITLKRNNKQKTLLKYSHKKTPETVEFRK
jgi:hypothetical protein